MAASVQFSFSDDDLSKLKANAKECRDKGSEFQALVLKRRGKRGVVTKTVNFVHQNLSTLTGDECKNYVGKLKKLLGDLEDLNDQVTKLAIEKEAYTDSEFEIQLETNELYSDRIGNALFCLESRCTVSASDTSSHEFSKVNLPKVDLPILMSVLRSLIGSLQLLNP